MWNVSYVEGRRITGRFDVFDVEQLLQRMNNEVLCAEKIIAPPIGKHNHLLVPFF